MKSQVKVSRLVAAVVFRTLHPETRECRDRICNITRDALHQPHLDTREVEPEWTQPTVISVGSGSGGSASGFDTTSAESYKASLVAKAIK
jgi:hypothetical protein